MPHLPVELLAWPPLCPTTYLPCGGWGLSLHLSACLPAQLYTSACWASQWNDRRPQACKLPVKPCISQIKGRVYRVLPTITDAAFPATSRAGTPSPIAATTHDASFSPNTLLCAQRRRILTWIMDGTYDLAAFAAQRRAAIVAWHHRLQRSSCRSWQHSHARLAPARPYAAAVWRAPRLDRWPLAPPVCAPAPASLPRTLLPIYTLYSS